MSDSYLLLTGIVVFGLMLIGVVLTAMEFKELKNRSRSAERDNAQLSTPSVQGLGDRPKSD